MDGRFFDQRKLEAFIAQGNEKFQKSKQKSINFGNDSDEEGDEGKRLDDFGSWLEEKGDE